jgi:hypothetical protein
VRALSATQAGDIVVEYKVDQRKIVRSLCLFTQRPSERAIERLGALAAPLQTAGYVVQTQRLCSPDLDAVFHLDKRAEGSIFFSVGRQELEQAGKMVDRFCAAQNVAFNVEASADQIDDRHVGLLTAIIKKCAAKTFSFTFTFNNALSSPYFPSATYEKEGFAIGLQPTDLSIGCTTVDEWLDRMQAAWIEIDSLMAVEEDYLGVDTSIAPLGDGAGSLVDLTRRIGPKFEHAITSGVFLKIADFIKTPSAKQIGLCGLMFPCLEDFELATEYERGAFSVERCMFLSLQSGLGLDAYPIAIDEEPARIAEVLTLLQGLSNKHRKPLSARFISDGIARIGQRTDLQSPYLRDVTVRAL